MTAPYPKVSTTADRTYENAMAIMEHRRLASRPGPKPVEQLTSKSDHHQPTARGVPSLLGMKEWLAALGHTEDDINALNIIHIAGTKGKGSTCSFTESFLRAHANRTGFLNKIGLYTSPHLLHPEERVRINFQPLQRDLLARYFFEVYDRLPQLAHLPDSSKPPVERGPRFLQLWALVAFHVFIREGVDAVIMETHNGGENDATNVVTKPLITAITTLGQDHIEILGNTIESIAWHKAGIYKEGAVALSTRQEPAAMEVLEQRAQKVGQKVNIIDNDPRLPATARHLEPSVQRQNASLAVAAAEAFLKQTCGNEKHELTPEDLEIGVAQWSWPGRYEILQRGVQTWFLDAAHCELSVARAAQWFAAESGARCGKTDHPTRVLVFSHMNKLRDARALLESLVSSLGQCNAGIHHVIFSTYDERVEETAARPQIFKTFTEVWQKYLPETRIWEEPAIEGAIKRVHKIGAEGDNMHVLVTGSQYLLGPALRQLNGSDQ